jgi:hypothetical protein
LEPIRPKELLQIAITTHERQMQLMPLEAKNRPTPGRLPEPEKPERDVVRPFDLRELEKLPTATDKDPPYRPWWAVDWT